MTERLEFKAALTVDDTGEITGIAWPFGSPDRVGDVIEKGAISMPASVPMLFAHDQGQVIGIWDQLAESSAGLTVKGHLLVDDVERAREVRAMIRSKAVTGLSIGFVTKSAKPRQGGRTITALNLHEISVVAVPSHPGAQITSIKAADDTATQKENHMENELENTPEAAADPVIEQKDFDALKARLDKMEAKANRPVAANNNNPDGANDNIERKALASFVRTGSDIEVKAAASDNNVNGGYFVLPTVDLSIRSLMTDLSPLRGLAEVVTISSDTYERFYALGKRGAQRVSQRDDRPQDTARPDLIKHSYGVGEYYAAPAATRHLLDDASVDIAAWLLDNAVHDFAETEGEDFLTYTGMDGFPRGLLDYGERAVRFLRLLKHPASTAPKSAFQLFDWQERIIRRIYGPRHPDGRRIVETVFWMIPRGNRKTSLAAALALLHTIGPERVPAGQVIFAASDREQAGLGFKEAANIIRMDKRLVAATKIYDAHNSAKKIAFKAEGVELQAISSDGAAQHGKTPSFVLVDEIHVWKGRDLWEALKSGMVKTSGTLMVIATTAGRGSENIGFDQYDYARRVALGEIENPAYLPIIFEAANDNDWQDEDLWHRVNPGLKHGFPNLNALRTAAKEAEHRPADRFAFKQFNLNVWMAHSRDPIFDMAVSKNSMPA